jgi:hypothetical protein
MVMGKKSHDHHDLGVIVELVEGSINENIIEKLVRAIRHNLRQL